MQAVRAMRILLYLLTNLLVVLTISLLLSRLTAAGLLPPALPLLQLLGPGGGASERWLLGTVAEPMQAALMRLGQASGVIDRRDGGALNTLKIAAPRSWFALFASHPPLEARIEALQVAPRLTAAVGSGWLGGR